MRWVGRSLLSVVPVVVGVVLCVFLLIRIVPGDPAAMILGDQATEASLEALRQRLGLNQPIGAQLWNWLEAVFTRGDIGTSLVTEQPVLGLVWSRAGITGWLVVLSVVCTVLLAVPLALLAATHAGGWIDQLVRVVPTIGMAMPAFWVGLLLILIFGVNLHWLPVGGVGTGPGEPWRSLVLPARTEVADRVSGLDAGADDYLPKPFSLDQLLARLRALLRRAAACTGAGRISPACLRTSISGPTNCRSPATKPAR